MMEGVGKYFNSENEIYEGEWHNSQRDGHGQFTYHDGTIYDGKWQADLRHGQGLMRYADGSVFSGNWAGDRRHGQGQMTFADGGQYQGTWAPDASSTQQWLSTHPRSPHWSPPVSDSGPTAPTRQHEPLHPGPAQNCGHFPAFWSH